MGDINFIGNNDDSDVGKSKHYDFDYTDPNRDVAAPKEKTPRLSFLKRNKKVKKKEVIEKPKEKEFVDKEVVRKGRYKSKAVPQKEKINDVNTIPDVHQSFAPQRTKSSQTPTVAAQSNSQQSGRQTAQLPARDATTSSSPGVQAAQVSSHAASNPVAPEVQDKPTWQADPRVKPLSPVSSPVIQPQTIPTAPPPPVYEVAVTKKQPPTIAKPVKVSLPAQAANKQSVIQTGVTQNMAPQKPISAPLSSTIVQSAGVTQPAYGQVPQKLYDTASQARIEETAFQYQSPAVQPNQVQQSSQPPVLTPAADSNLPQFKTQTLQRIIPTPPPPPEPIPREVKNETQPVAQPMSVNLPGQQPLTQPVLPAATIPQAPSAQITPSSAAGPAGQSRRPSSQPEQAGIVYARNVEQIHGQETNPEVIDGKFLAVNLLPLDFLKQLSPSRRISGLLRAALFSFIVIGIIYGAMVSYQSYFIIQTKNNQVEITRLENEIRTYGTLQNKINSTNDQLEAVNQLLDQHIYWSNVFTMLEKYTLPNVYYTSFSGNTGGAISLQAATTDYASISRQVHIFSEQTNEVQSVSVTTATRTNYKSSEEEDTKKSENGAIEKVVTDSEESAGVISFSLNVQLDPSIFSYQRDDAIE